MDVKDLRTETALSERNNDGSKYTQGGIALQCNRNKSYQDIGPNPLAKTDPAPVRPCAVIGPDRVVPPPASNDAYLKKGSVEPWPSPDNVYRRPPEYPHKVTNNPSRNISPRQTFQENMQRIMVPPSYSAVRHNDDPNFNSVQDRGVISKNNKPNLASEANYCDVPYAINTLTNEPKNIRDSEMYVPSVNSPLTRTVPPGWTPSGINMHAPRTYATHEIYQYPQYPSCAGPRPSIIPISRPPRTIQEEPGYVYPDHYYQDPSIRFKPYPPVKERYPQPRYEYITNYPSPFHPPHPLPTHKYDISKPGQQHPYSIYPHLKYLENRVPDHTIEGYQRATNQQPHYNIPFRNQMHHPTFPPVAGNTQNKVHPYPTDPSIKSVAINKLSYDNNNKMYIDYESSRAKTYPGTDNYFVNEMARVHPIKNQMPIPNYSCIGVPSTPSQQYYRKDSSHSKPYEYMPHFRNFDPTITSKNMMRHLPRFSPNTLAISPTDSTISIDTAQTQGTSQEDCGYVSQSSTTSVRSVDSGLYTLQNEYYKRYDYRYGPIVGSSPTLSKSEFNCNRNTNSKDSKQKQIDVRQFLQMWNEGEDDNSESNNAKEIVIQTGTADTTNFQTHHGNNQDQLYVLGLVNVPSEELDKYEHIQKISKLPENIKGYNNLELLSQFEEAIESSNTNVFKSITKEYQMSKNNSPKQVIEALPRPVSPLDVEAKISQSVIHKEVGCNFEIRPCSPKMLNVEVAAPVQNILGERVIEKVTNPLSKIAKSPMPIKSDENPMCNNVKRQEKSFTTNDNPSCKMTNNSSYVLNSIDSVKTNYSLQDLEINSGVCLASLPRLDNEIELNFPEVNQQFINANKKDVDSSQNNAFRSAEKEESNLPDKGLTKTDLGKCEKIVITDEKNTPFIKLSKYRKIKPNVIDLPEQTQATKILRTDSVIIKNPENIENKQLESSLNIPMNLTSQFSTSHEFNLEPLDNQITDEQKDIDIALDFSLNKTGKGLPIINVEKDEYTELVSTELSEKTCDKESVLESSEICNKYDKVSDNLFNEEVKETVDHNKIRPIDVEHTAVANNIENPRPGCLTSKNILTSTNIDSNKGQEKSVCEESCIINEEIGTQEEATISSDNHFKAERSTDSNLLNNSELIFPSRDIISKCEEIQTTSQLSFSTKNEPEVKILNGEVESSQNDLNLEHDEISASLEKLFKDTNDDTVLGSTEIVDIALYTHKKAVCGYQSKELYSPWIQKLIMHSEGLCSVFEVSGESKNSVYSILNDDEASNDLKQTKPISIEIIHSVEIDRTNKITEVLPSTTSSEDMSPECLDDFISGSKSKNSRDFDIKHCSPSIEVELSLALGSNNCLHNKQDISNAEYKEKQSDGFLYQLRQNQNDDTKSEFQNINCDIENEVNTSAISSIKDESITEGDNCKFKTCVDVNTNNDVCKNYINLSVTSQEHCVLAEVDVLSKDETFVVDKTVLTTSQDKEIFDSTVSINECEGRREDFNAAILKSVPNMVSQNDDCKQANEVKNSDKVIENCAKPDTDTVKISETLTNTIKLNAFDHDTKENSLDFTPQTRHNFCPENLNGTCRLNSADFNAENVKYSCPESKNLSDVCPQNLLETKTKILESARDSNLEKVCDNITCLGNTSDSDVVYCTNHNNTNFECDENIKNELFIADEEKCKSMTSLDTDGEPSRVIQSSNNKLNTNNNFDNVSNSVSDSWSDHHKIDTLIENNTETKIINIIKLAEESGNTNQNIKNEHIQLKNENKGKNNECTNKIYSPKRNVSLKRSYSDSALNTYSHRDSAVKQNVENTSLGWPCKRQRIYEFENPEQNLTAENLCSIIQHNRRNSVSSYCNDDNVSFCILIDNNCILTEETEEEKICFAEIAEECMDEINVTNEEEPESIVNTCSEESQLHYSNSVILNYEDEKPIQESWIDDVACVETVVSDDIVDEDVSAQVSPKYIEDSIHDEYDIFNCAINENTNGIPFMDEENITENVSEIVETYGTDSERGIKVIDNNSPELEIFGTYRTSHIDINRMLSGRDSGHCSSLFGEETLEKILMESNSTECSLSSTSDYTETIFTPDEITKIPDDKENIFVENISTLQDDKDSVEYKSSKRSGDESRYEDTNHTVTISNVIHEQDVHSCESSIDNVFSYKHNEENVSYTTSSSPEVSSTTSEEKSSSILLKITNYNGSIVSEVNEINRNRPRCKFTEKKEYSNSHAGFPNRPLLTKAAQKYIPPLKESIRDLKVKLSLPQQRLLKLKQLKLSRSEPKVPKQNNIVSIIPRKPKPNFEDVLKSIDEVQIKMHKEKCKKVKHIVPKVVIKKTLNGSHYTSSSNKDTFNPDLTGRKWQPWVFLEKNHFIDKMATRNKTKAIFNHRKNTYVLAEKFKKYKSASSAKFVISQPKAGDLSQGQLKYTIRLKHTY